MSLSLVNHLGTTASKVQRERTLAWHLAILCLALSAPILLSAALITWSNAKAERGRIEQNALSTARQVAAAVDRQFADHIATAKALALSRSLQEGDLARFDAHARKIYEETGFNVVLRDPNSQQIVNSRVPRGTPLPTTTVETAYDREVKTTRKPYVSDLMMGLAARKPLFIVSVPVFRGDEIIYILSLSLEPAHIGKIIGQRAVDANYTVTVADRRGSVVATSGSHQTPVNQQLPMPIQQELSQREGVVFAKSFADDHEPTIMAFGTVELSGWHAIVTVPSELVAAPAYRSLLSLFGVGVALMTLSLGLAVLFSLRIDRPVSALTEQAARLARGEPVDQLTTAVSEVNELSNALVEADRYRRETDFTLRSHEQHLRALQFELLHASRLSSMGQMTAALAHELNQPLGAATNYLNAALLTLKADHSDTSERTKTRLVRAAEQTIRAGTILSRLRDFITRGETERSVVSSQKLVEDAAALALIGVNDPSLQIKFNFEKKERPILADQIQIQQVIFNLVRNAIEATEGKTPREIIVATHAPTKEELEISVADNGSGLPQDPEVVFEAFKSTKVTGMGVGLSVCRTIIDAHGGHIWAEPRPGGGAIFRFTVPRAPSEEAIHG